MRQVAEGSVSVSVQTRVKPMPLAECLIYFIGEGYRIKTRSELVSLCVETLAGLVRQVGKVDQVTHLDDAIRLLEAVFGEGSMTPSGRGRASLLAALGQKQERVELGLVDLAYRSKKDFSEPGQTELDAEIRAAAEAFAKKSEVWSKVVGEGEPVARPVSEEEFACREQAKLDAIRAGRPSETIEVEEE